VAQILGSELSEYIANNYTDILEKIKYLGKGVCEVDDLLNDILLSSSEEFIDLTPYGDSKDRSMKYITGRIRNKVLEEYKRTALTKVLDDNTCGESNDFSFGEGIQKRNKKPMLHQGDEKGLKEFWENELKCSFIEDPIACEGIYDGTLEYLTLNIDSDNPVGSNANNMLVTAYIYGKLTGGLEEGLSERVSLDLTNIKGVLDGNEKFSRNIVDRLKGVAEILSVGLQGTGTFLLDSEPVEVSENRARSLIKCFDRIFASSVEGCKGLASDKKTMLLRVLKLLYLFHRHEGDEEYLADVLGRSFIGLPLQEIRLGDISVPDIDMGLIGSDNLLEWLSELFQVESSVAKVVVNFGKIQGKGLKGTSTSRAKVTHINFLGRHLNISEVDYISLNRGVLS
jgi:hypothetical protein